jgi:hypothetical protein
MGITANPNDDSQYEFQLTLFDPATEMKNTVKFVVDGYDLSDSGVLQFYERVRQTKGRAELRLMRAFSPQAWLELTAVKKQQQPQQEGEKQK